VFLREREDGAEIGGVAREMDHDDGLGFLRNAGGNRLGRDVVRVRIHVGEDGHAALCEDGDDGALIGDGRRDDFVARPYPHRGRGHVQGRRTARHHVAMLHAVQRGELAPERLHLLAEPIEKASAGRAPP